MVEFLWIDSRPLDCALAGDGSEFLGCEVFELAAVAAKRRARPTYDTDVTGLQHCFPDCDWVITKCKQMISIQKSSLSEPQLGTKQMELRSEPNLLV
jgi:hypothetical protein